LFDKATAITTVERYEKYIKGFLNSIGYRNDFVISYRKIEEFNQIKRKEINILYNELILYGKMKKSSQYILDALLIQFISYLNLNIITLANMKWKNFLVLKTGNPDRYWIHFPKFSAELMNKNGKTSTKMNYKKMEFEYIQVNNDFGTIIKNVLSWVEVLDKINIENNLSLVVLGAHENFPKQEEGKHLFGCKTHSALSKRISNRLSNL
jgi:hypothetical protein